MSPRGKGPPSDGVLKAPENTPIPQTDLDQTQVTAGSAENSAGEGANPQTDPILKVQPRKRVTAREIAPQSATEESAAKPATEDPVEEVTFSRTRIRMEMPVPNTEVLAIDDELGVQTELEKARDKFLDLVESVKTGRYLTDRIQGVEKHSSGGEPRAVIYHGDYKVIIMASMLIDLPRDLREREPNEMYLYLMQKRLGSEIDYVVKGIDSNTGLAVGSRKEAMATKRRHYYLNTTREGTYRIYEGLVCEARVSSVIPEGIFAELFGIDVFIPLRELSYVRIPDAMGYFEPGDRILVKITRLDRSDPNNIRVSASVKQVAASPTEKALEKVEVGGHYAGTVTMIDPTGIYVQLDMGAECKCKFPLRARPPVDARVIVLIDGVSMQSRQVWGKITYITIPK